MLPLPPGLPLSHSQELTPGAPPSGPQPRPSTAVDPNVEPTLLRHPQVRPRPWGCGCGLGRNWRPPNQPPWAGGPGSSGTSSGLPLVSPHLSAHGRLSLQGTVVFNTHVPALGRYAFLLHSYQPAHPTFPVEVLINGGRVWQGEWLWPAIGDSSW